MLNSQEYYDFLEKLFHGTRVFNTSGTHVQYYLGKIQIEKAVQYVCETQPFSPKRNYVHCFDMSAVNISALSSLSFISSQLFLLALH